LPLPIRLTKAQRGLCRLGLTYNVWITGVDRFNKTIPNDRLFIYDFLWKIKPNLLIYFVLIFAKEATNPYRFSRSHLYNYLAGL